MTQRESRTGVGASPEEAKRKAYLTHDQVNSLASRSAYPLMVYFLAYTGLRWGEATALRVRDLDPIRNRVLVSENAVMLSGAIHIGTPKTHHARSVPVPPFLIQERQTATTRRVLVRGWGFAGSPAELEERLVRGSGCAIHGG